MKFNLKNVPDKGDEKYWFENSDWISEFDYTKFNTDLGEWREGFEKELREWLENNKKGVFIPYGNGRRLEPQTIECIKEILGE